MSAAHQILLAEPPFGDPYWANVVLLIPGAGTLGGAPVDLSLLANSITNSGVVYDNAHAKFGSTSLKFTSPNFFTIASSTSLYAGTSQDFTIECWVNFNGAAANAWFVGQDNGSGSANGFNEIWVNDSGGNLITRLDCKDTSGANQVDATGGAQSFDASWHHVAFARHGRDLWGYYDGVFNNGGVNQFASRSHFA